MKKKFFLIYIFLFCYTLFLYSGRAKDDKVELGKEGKNNKDVVTCAICLENLNEQDGLAPFECPGRIKHTFHKNCCAELFFHEKNKSCCPLCKRLAKDVKELSSLGNLVCLFVRAANDRGRSGIEELRKRIRVYGLDIKNYCFFESPEGLISIIFVFEDTFICNNEDDFVSGLLWYEDFCDCKKLCEICFNIFGDNSKLVIKNSVLKMVCFGSRVVLLCPVMINVGREHGRGVNTFVAADGINVPRALLPH
jgi:hypothetical protein